MKRQERSGRAWAAGLVIVALVAVAGAYYALGPGRGGHAEYDGPVRAVARGPLTISVSEAGSIEAREKVVLKCEVDERTTTITYIVPEGKLVEAGEVVVRLDASVLQDELYDEQIDVTDREAEYLAAKENLEVVRNQGRSDMLQAQLALRFAREDVKKYIEGEFPKQQMEVQNRVTLAEEEREQARDTLEWSEKLHESEFLAATELNRDRLTFQRAELELELAKAEADLLAKYTHERQLAQLESDVQQAELALERVERKATADLVQAEARLTARKQQLERQRHQLADIEKQIDSCTIEAPVSGMAVYATTGQGDWRGNDEPLQVGREVSHQEELIHIPVANAKKARIQVHESSLKKVQVGQPVRVTTDFLPGRVFRGRVARIAPLPDAQSRWMNPDLKVYDTDIELEGEIEGIRTGMSCRAEILVEQHADALYVPVHAVVRVGAQPTVYVVQEGRLVPRPIEVGLDNNRMVHVLSGLEEGEQVALAPPLSEGEKKEDGRERLDEPLDEPEPPSDEDRPPRDEDPDDGEGRARSAEGGDDEDGRSS